MSSKEQKNPSGVVNRTAYKRSNKTKQEESESKQKKDDKPKIKKKPYIGKIDDPNLEDFIIDNPHLKTGYRVFFNTYWDCARSLFMIHNETMNVWSHLIGLIIFIGIIIYLTICLQPSSMHESTDMMKRW